MAAVSGATASLASLAATTTDRFGVTGAGSEVRGRRTSVEFSKRKDQAVANQGAYDAFAADILDFDRMEEVFKKEDQEAEKRMVRLKRYYFLNTLIVYFLVAMGLMGFGLALLKTVLVPSTIKFFAEEVENVSLLILLDTSQHNRISREAQVSVVKNMTGNLNNAMIARREAREATLKEQLRNASAQESLQIPIPNRDVARAIGSQLSVSVAVFNGLATQVFDYTEDLDQSDQALDSIEDAKYRGVAEWFEALKYCEKVGRENPARDGVKRYCVLFSDSDAMCTRSLHPNVKEFCNNFPDVCPEQVNPLNESTLEYAEGIAQCTNFSQQLKETSDQEVIMMLTVQSEGEAQVAYKSDGFRSFVVGSTGCDITGRETVWTNPSTGRNRSDTTYSYQEDSPECLTFVVAENFSTLSEKARQLSEALVASDAPKAIENSDETNYTYLYFLLLMLGYPCFLAWVKIAKWISSVNKKRRMALGEKKKLFKVTKTLIEKEIKDAIMDQYTAQLEEVELQELEMTRPTIRCGTMMTLRGRVKGSYLQANSGNNKVDGHGKGAGREACHWIFSHFGDEQEADLQIGLEFKMKTVSGMQLYVTSDGAVDLRQDSQESLPNNEFVIVAVNTDEDPECVHPGQQIRIKSVVTGKFLRVHKDGRVDATALEKNIEGQMVIDIGGPALNRGSIITMRAGIFKRFAKGLTDGEVITANNDEDEDRDGLQVGLSDINNYRFWYMSYVKDPGVGAVQSELTELSSEDDNPVINQRSGYPVAKPKRLKPGDIIQLQSMDAKYLQVDTNGELRASQTEKDAEESLMFTVSRVGNAVTHHKDRYIRSGASVALKRLTRGPEDQDLRVSYLKVNEDGHLTIDGRLGDEDTCFIMETANISQVLEPVQKQVAIGDITIILQSPWDKTSIKKIDAQGSAWNKDQDLKNFEGQMVIASKQGSYKVPRGSTDGWICVMHEGVDIQAAAEKIKGQGGCGLILLTDQIFSMERLSDAAIRLDKPNKQPVLPVIHVPQRFEKELTEKGLIVKGVETRNKSIGNIMTNLGRVGAPGGDTGDALQKLLANTGVLIQELLAVHLKEVEARREFEEKEREKRKRAAAKEANNKYKWKGQYARRQSNATYTPNSGRRNSRRGGMKLGVSVLSQADLMADLDSFQGELEFEQEGELELEQLDEESDFKIEHVVQEIEVALNAKQEDIQEEEDEEVLADQEGRSVGRLAVPRRFFWITIVMLVLITVGLLFLIGSILQYQGRDWTNEEIREAMRNAVNSTNPEAAAKVLASTKATMFRE